MEKYIQLAEKSVEWAKANKTKAIFIGFVAFIVISEIIKAV